MQHFEVNFDGLVGPTHNYSGLSYGNIASTEHQYQISRPRQAALQGLEKMALLMRMGIKQAVLPPHERPHLPTLRMLGYTDLANVDPLMLAQCSAAASMWAANSATVTPSLDTPDHRLHVTPANLQSKLHRTIEAPVTTRIIQAIFNDPKHFVVHPPLIQSHSIADEGAANHTRFCKDINSPGIHLFVYGRNGLTKDDSDPKIFPARQTFEASQAIARRHGLSEKQTVLARQNPEAIDQGVFHNDVISTGYESLFLVHEKAFVSQNTVLKEIENKCPWNLNIIQVNERDVSIQDAVSTYLFNSQIVRSPEGLILIVPEECILHPKVNEYLLKLSGTFTKILPVNVRESMQNGGGPACLRLRVLMSETEIGAIRPRVILDENLYRDLKDWIEKHYRETLQPKDLKDPQLLKESLTALDDLTSILKLGSIYDFQRV